ncbi:hypothetical protein MHTCC0001_07990 [Flavobacteriaceae bacterium MHTCC 0001]
MTIIKIKNTLLLLLLGFSLTINAQLDFGGTALPSRLGNANNWTVDTAASDDFNYNFNATSNNADFGPSGQNKWNNFFHNGFEGPGATKWVRNHVAVSGGNLNLWASRVQGNTKSFEFGGQTISRPETRAGCITSKTRVKYPVFVEARLRIMNSSLATDVWLLSPDDKEEIDIIEAYGGGMSDGRNNFFAERIHLSHHVFIRPPNFKDYQPSDWNSWYRQSGVSQWGGRIVRIGVYWKSPTVLEYYIDGQLVRVLDNDAIASKLRNGTWEYTYPAGVTSTGQNGQLERETSGSQQGFQKMVVSSTSSNFNQNNLNTAKNQSNISVIDPFNYLTNGRKFSREMDIIINVEDQSWQAAANRSPNNTEIQNFDNNLMLVDWIRVLKPNNSGGNNNNNTPLTCDTAPDYNGNANSYSPGDRVVNTSDNRLYERTATGWNLIEDCGNNSSGNNNNNNNNNNSGNNNGGSTGAAIPGTIQAESYSNMNGVQTQNTSDSGGGQNVGWINSGDWMDYAVNVATAGTYTVNFRVASRSNNIRFDLRSGNNVLTSVNSSSSGGWQNWKTVSATVNLAAGSQTLRILATGAGWNINWMQFVSAGNSGGNSGSGTTCANAPAFNGDANSYSAGDRVINGGVLYEKRADGGWNLIQNCSTSKQAKLKSQQEEIPTNYIGIYPNPAHDHVNILLEESINKADIRIFDIQGKVVFSEVIKGNSSTVDTSNFNKGLYIIQVNTKEKSFNKKLVVR